MRPSINTLALAISASLLISGCNDSNKKHHGDLVIKDHKNVHKAQGVWHKKAYGEITEIANNRVKQYEFNQHACTLISDKSYQDVMQDKVSTLRLIKAEQLEVQERDSVSAYILSKDKALPETCKTPFKTGRTSTPTETFEYFWHTFNDYYAFFELRGVNWQAQYDIYAPRVTDNMNNDALFEVLSEMITPLQDAHVYIEGDDGTFSTMKPVPALKSATGTARALLRFGAHVEVDDVVANLLNNVRETSMRYMTSQSTQHFPQEGSTKTATWGITHDNIGILVLNNMAEYHENPKASEVEQLKAAETFIDKVLVEFKDTEGLILDIRYNQGGDDAISIAIANRFANENKLAVNKQAVNRSGRGVSTSFKLTKRDNAYTKPVYLLTSQATVSAAEVFTMAMKQLSHVTHVGEETSGALSDVLSFHLPNGWEIGLSNEIYRNAQGNSFEKHGLKPDVEVNAFTNLEDEIQHFATYDHALAAMGKQTYAPLTLADFEQRVSQLVTEGQIPGLALAVISNGQVQYVNGFGIADEGQAPVNADTPFYIASLSKTLVGATIAHAVAEQAISLDEPVTPVLPFDTDILAEAQTSITLRHLITHTSGIIDANPAYLCSYYIHATKQNINDALLGQDNCDAEINTDLPLYLSDYFNRSGRYYQEANFSTQYGYNTGEVYIYSNIATALAAYTLEQKINTPFVELAQNYLFTPLSMSHSTWGLDKPITGVATRFVHNPSTAQRVAMPSYGAITYADGSAISTANDLSRFLIASMNEGKIGQQQILSRQAVNAMLTPQTDVAVPSRDVGYFWDIDGDYIHHNGSDPGVMSRMIGNVKTKNGVIILSNGDENYQPNSDAMEAIWLLALQLANSK